MAKKKSRFLTFCFSMLPGAGEMYMGFMKMGVSLMAMFFCIIAVASFLEIGPIMAIAAIVWFYSFFHVNNLAGMPDEEFHQIEDDYLIHFEGKDYMNGTLIQSYRKVISIALIIFGVVLCVKGVSNIVLRYAPDYICRIVNIVSYNLPQVVVGIAIVAIGVTMIRGKKKELTEDGNNEN